MEHIWKTVRQNVLLPLATRAGTVIGTGLAGYGLANDSSHQLGTLVASAGLIIADIVADWLIRRQAK